MKYIDAEKLIDELTKMQFELNAAYRKPQSDNIVRAISLEYDDVISLITSLQQDPKALMLEMCNQSYWEDRGYIMIPPNVTLKGIESLLESVRHTIKCNEEHGIKEHEQPEVDLDKEIKEYFKGWTETDEGIACHYQYVDLNTCRGIAHYFYELGINARKEE